MAKLDISDRDYLACWLSKAYEVDSAEVIKRNSGCVPRLDRWLAAEISKGCENVPELQFKIMGYIEGCTRLGNPPRGRYLLRIVSRHFDIDRARGSLLTSQSIFQIELDGYSAKHLQEFSGRVLRTLNSVPQEDWPSQRMMGEWLFHRLRQVRKLERTILLRSRGAMLSRHSVILIFFGLDCRNTCLRKGRTSMRSPLKSC